MIEEINKKKGWDIVFCLKSINIKTIIYQIEEK
jgi:hypothetical protein